MVEILVATKCGKFVKDSYFCNYEMQKMTHYMNFEKVYNNTIEQIAEQLSTDLAQGLSTEEAAARLARDGYNEFRKTKHTTLLVKFLAQFKSFMILVLIAAAVISGVVGVMEGEGFTDAIIIMVIVVLNAIIGVAQEAKAEKSLDALEKMAAPHCKVVRGGEVQVIESRELVVGDEIGRAHV